MSAIGIFHKPQNNINLLYKLGPKLEFQNTKYLSTFRTNYKPGIFTLSLDTTIRCNCKEVEMLSSFCYKGRRDFRAEISQFIVTSLFSRKMCINRNLEFEDRPMVL